MKRKLFSFLMALCMVLSLLPATAWAEVYQHYFGEEGVSFVYDTNTQTLTISGWGYIPDRDFESEGSAFSKFGFSVDDVRTVVIEYGVTRIGKMAFYKFTNLTSVTIPETVTEIRPRAFAYCNSLRSLTLPKSLKIIRSTPFSDCPSLTSLTFLGDVPTFTDSIGSITAPTRNIAATIYYPAGNPTWTPEVLQRLAATAIPVCMGSHDYGAWVNVDEATHQRNCTYCEYSETTDHAWDAGTVTTAPTCQATGEALYTCTGCGATKNETLPIADHPYSPWEKVDDQTHTHSCTVCGKDETVDHSWDEGTVLKAPNCIADGEMLYTCTGCRLTRSETMAMTGIHTYDHGCDKECNICGATRTTSHSYSADWASDKSGHWHVCVNCRQKDAVVNHTPGPEATEETAQTCTVCGYIIKPTLQHEHAFADTLTGDESGHWYPCASCSEQKDLADHAFDNDCDTKCETCGYERFTEHQWDEAWSSDETSHFHACTVCGEKKDSADHAWRRGECTVCAAEDPNYEPPVLPIVIGAAVCAAGVGAAFVWRGKKKKRAA